MPKKAALLPNGVLAPHNLPYQMLLLVQQMTRQLQEVLQPYGLTPLHWGILCCLWVEDGLRTAEICARLEQLGGTVTVGLDGMEARRLIRRKADARDRRVSRIFLTPAAKQLEGKLVPAVTALVTELFAPLTSEEAQGLYREVARLRQHIEALHAPASISQQASG